MIAVIIGSPNQTLNCCKISFPICFSSAPNFRSVRHRSAEELYAALKAGGHQILATSCTPESKPLGAYDFTKPTAVIMGNEHSGVPAELNSLVDGEVYIPMYGMIQSFNVSVAAAVILSEASRQRVQAGMYDRPSYPPDELAARLEAWIEK